MAHKELKYDQEARTALEAGVDAVANAVKVTLGPKGRYVVLERILDIDLTSDGDPVVGDRRRAELLVEDDVATLRPERDLDRVGQLVDPGFEATARVFIELQEL